MKTNIPSLLAALLLLVCIIMLPGFSANAEADNGIITGKIIEDSTSLPVSYASVALLSASDSSLLTGKITDDKGNFQFENVPYGKYNLKVSFVGYKSLTIKNIELNRENKKIDLPEMKMVEEITALQETVIVGQRLKGEEKIDRTVFTLNDDLRKAATSGLDVLKHIPSVTVDLQKNVTLEGQSNIQFYVDGVLRNKDFIAQINPETIDKIEVITNPGVKYDADISGVINIVLKKEQKSGVNGSVVIPIFYPNKIVTEPNANIEYGNQDFRIYAGNRCHIEKFNGTELHTTDLNELNSKPYKYSYLGEGKLGFQYNYMNYGIDWFINDKTSLNFLGEWTNWKMVYDNYQTDSRIFNYDVLSQYQKSEKNSMDKSNNYYFSLFLKRKLNKEGNELTAEGYYNRQTGNTKNNYSDSYINLIDLYTVDGIVERNEFIDNLKNNTELKLDYTFLLKNVKNELGLRTYYSWMNNNYINGYTIEEITNEKVEEFGYNESRQSAYYNLSGKIKKYSWQAGLKGEYSNIHINSTSSTDYLVLLPQFNFSRSMEKEQNLKLSYRKQIFRPSISDLNPFETWSDSLHVSRGNPDLNPAMENRFELTYSKNFKANYISPKIYLRTMRNGIRDITTVSSDGITEITQGNIGRSMEYGIGLNTAVQILKRWRLNANVSVFDRIFHVDQDLPTERKEEKLSCRLNFSNIITLPKDYTLMLMGNYGSPNMGYQRIFSRDMLILVGAEKKFSDKLTISGFYVPILKNFMYSKVVTTTPGYRDVIKGELDVKNLFSFEISYKFNHGKNVNKINRSAEYDKEESKGGL
jgi:hypothetical protein